MVKNEMRTMKDTNEQIFMEKMKQKLKLVSNTNTFCSDGDCTVDSILCHNVTSGMVTESSGEDGVDEAVEVENGNIEDSQDDQEQKSEEKETMKTSGQYFVFCSKDDNPFTNNRVYVYRFLECTFIQNRLFLRPQM